MHHVRELVVDQWVEGRRVAVADGDGPAGSATRWRPGSPEGEGVALAGGPEQRRDPPRHPRAQRQGLEALAPRRPEPAGRVTESPPPNEANGTRVQQTDGCRTDHEARRSG